jgi:DNA ligase-1
MFSGSVGHAATVAFELGDEGLACVGLDVMRPVLPMLAATAPSVDEALASFGEAALEWKLDGVRIQVHRRGDLVRVFTRNLNDVTDRLPAVVAVALSLDAEAVVLDGEALSVDPSGEPAPFQETMSRFGADAPPDDVGVRPFFFDLLHLDGSDLVASPLVERRRLLETIVPPEALIPRLVTSDPGEAAEFLAEARRHRHEGVMVKDPSSVYEAGRRGASWLKVKPAHTLDLVVLAAEWGHGRRTGWLSNLHLGARDPRTAEFVMLGKTFKGLTDEVLAWQTERFLEIEIRRTRGTVFVRPELVVEIAFDGVLRSPRYPAGMSLRFARVKGYRPDKSAAGADTVDTVRAIFEGRM